MVEYRMGKRANTRKPAIYMHFAAMKREQCQKQSTRFKMLIDSGVA